MDDKSDPKADATATPLPRNEVEIYTGKREVEGVDEKQVSAKKQKREEVAEEQKNIEEVISDDFFSDSEPDKRNVYIDCDNSEKSDEEAQEKKMEVLMDAVSNAQGRDLKLFENDLSSYNSDEDEDGSDVIEKLHMIANPKTLATPKEDDASKTIYTGNLSYSVERADMEDLFKECGEIVDVRLHTDHEGRFRGFGHVEFATAEAAQKALQLNNTELLRCPIRIDIAQEKGKSNPNRSKFSSWRFQKCERIQGIKGTQSSEYCEEEIEGIASKIPWESPKMLATWKEQNDTSKTIYVRNLSYSAERADMEILFKECGEIIDVHLNTDHEGRFSGFGHVEFATAEAARKALGLDNTELLRRRIRVGIAQEKGEYASNRRIWTNTFQKSERIQPIKGTESSESCEAEIEGKASKSPWEIPKMLATLEEKSAPSKIIRVRNLSYRVERADIETLFKECGQIVDVRLNMDHEGRFRGFGHVEFATAEAAQKALELDNTELLSRRISVGIAQEKGGYTFNRSNWGNTFQKSDRIQPIKGAENSEYCEQDIEGKAYKSPWENPKMLASWKEKNDPSKTICVRNLSYRVERADMEILFKECGEIVDVHLHTDHEGRLNGFGQVEFATVEAAQRALDLDNTELLRRRIRVGIAREKGEYTHNRSNCSNWSNSFQTSGRVQAMKDTDHLEDCGEEIEEKAWKTQESPTTLATPREQHAASKTIFVGNLSYGVGRADVEYLFKECGEIVDVRLHTDHEGRPRGFGHVKFATAQAVQKALELDNTELLRRPIRVELAREKGEYTHNSR
ncbi:nucleolin 1-like isoform X2 [Abrus precatorius]|uniref:Nucleolin 1-like isoform X2 n=1 Tax=Abrus precatorius TaxID=3816 RepID=A0A8B8LTX2_ABRPR|nr:nucleolin 1-like isoform X2 [Abrus precatorius]